MFSLLPESIVCTIKDWGWQYQFCVTNKYTRTVRTNGEFEILFPSKKKTKPRSFNFVLKAKSRTKEYSYGLFWKNNRKDCCIFFSHETLNGCNEHMDWIKSSIGKLELHRESKCVWVMNFFTIVNRYLDLQIFF